MIWRKKFSKETKNRDRKIIKLSHCETGTKNFREIALQNSSCLVLKFRQSNAFTKNINYTVDLTEKIFPQLHSMQFTKFLYHLKIIS